MQGMEVGIQELGKATAEKSVSNHLGSLMDNSSKTVFQPTPMPQYFQQSDNVGRGNVLLQNFLTNPC